MPAPVRSRHALVPVLLSLLTGLATLTLVAAPPSSAAPPDYDNLADAATVSLAAGASTSLDLTTAEATRETGEPTPCGSIKNTVWVAYTALDDQLVTVRTTAATTQMDTVLAVHAGTSATYPLGSQVGCNDDTTPGRLSRVQFGAVAGSTYYVQVGHYGGGSVQTGDPGPGPLGLEVTAAAAAPGDNVGAPISLGDAASGLTSVDTTNATHATTDPPLPTSSTRTLWYTWQAASDGYVHFFASGDDPVSPDTFLFAFPATGDTTMATAIAYKDDLDEDNEDFRGDITFPTVAGTTYRILVGTRFGHGPFAMNWNQATPNPAPGNDAFADATAISGDSGSSTGNTQDATPEPQDPNLSGTSGGHSVWYRWTAPQDGVYEFATAESTVGVDTVLAVLTGGALGSLQQVDFNDDDGTGVTSSLRFDADAGTTYTILVDGWPSRTRGEFILRWELIPPVTTTTVLTATTPDPGLVDLTVTVTRSDGDPASGSVAIYDGGGDAIAGLGLTGGTVSRRLRNQAGGTHHYYAEFLPDSSVEIASTSATVDLPIVARTPPANDDFADATAITGSTGTSGPVDLLGATREDGDPSLDIDADGATVWYRWTAPVSDAFTFTVSSAAVGADTLVGALRGATLSDLTLLRSSRDPAGAGSEITFSAIEGRSYYILVDAVVPAAASLAWSRAGGTATTTTLTATSGGVLAYNLQATVTGATDGTVIFLRDGAVVGEEDTGTGSATLNRTFQRPGASTFTAEFYPDDPTVRPSESAPRPLTVTAPPAPANDLFANAAGLPGDTTGGPVSGTTYGATADAGTPPSTLEGTAGTTVWYRWVAPVSGSVEFTAARTQTGVDTVLRAYEGTTLATLRTLDENDDGTSTDNSIVGISAVAGRTYYLAVDAYRFNDDMGPFQLTWAPATTPGVTTTGLNAAVSGRTVTLTASVDDPAATDHPAGYVEFLEGTTSRGVVLVDADNATAVLALANVTPGAHSYSARFVPNDYTYAQSTSPARAVTVAKVASRTTLAAPARVRPGARPTVTATVKLGSANATGSVRFTLNGRTIRTVALRNGRAATQLPTLAAGTARVVATYLGTAVNATSTASRTITVRR